MTGLKTNSLVLKIWQEELADDQEGVRIRGEIRDPVKRETKYFNDWPSLITVLERCLDIEKADCLPHDD
ncbi:MAG: hypothetical protein ACI9EW_003697 [Cellvibrionaceae bacterium]|jgi:hypothetical protein